eukprot:CAMPEP_0175316570 /NCGR_PEP_ID=MMETSP0093-20121207/69481_1 /TAXON_ID=311494 /ORGANISM="Alexandrium monilatum, Strain CCMP3105" /LENGTH=104 /DNA_ID=CAMNT_0016613339 /DNA_START=279 /DNA_END=589 /DNA_ORIENTATION=+
MLTLGCSATCRGGPARQCPPRTAAARCGSSSLHGPRRGSGAQRTSLRWLAAFAARKSLQSCEVRILAARRAKTSAASEEWRARAAAPAWPALRAAAAGTAALPP